MNLYYYDTLLSIGHKRRSLNIIKRKRNRRFQKEENKSLFIFFLGTIIFSFICAWALLNSPTFIK